MDRVIPGWIDPAYAHHIRTWVPGQGWKVESCVSSEEKLRLIDELEGKIIDMKSMVIKGELLDLVSRALERELLHVEPVDVDGEL